MRDLLTYNKKGLELFSNPIQIDYMRPKWANVVKDATRDVIYSNNNVALFDEESVTDPDGNINVRGFGVDPGGDADMKSAVAKFDSIASLGLKELNTFVNDNKNGILSCLGATGLYSSASPWRDSQSGIAYDSYDKSKKSFFKKLLDKFKKTIEPKPELNVIQFFTAIKATTLESAEGYVNRVSKYLSAIHNAYSIGQTALVDKLAREMLANKYESFLAAEGYYYIVSEEQVVNFAKKSEKGVALDYIKNFVRPIPESIAEKIRKADELEIFDNYVIMHYDPQSRSYMETAKEEINKRRDPIVFGVIAGSTNLYYIADWVDDYCDLTLTKFVDTLGIKKEELIKDEEALRKEKEAKKNANSDKKGKKKTTKKKNK